MTYVVAVGVVLLAYYLGRWHVSQSNADMASGALGAVLHLKERIDKGLFRSVDAVRVYVLQMEQEIVRKLSKAIDE